MGVIVLFVFVQFATESQIGSFNIGEKTFTQNFAARPFCITFEEKQFVLEICRKQNTGKDACLGIWNSKNTDKELWHWIINCYP